MMELEMNADFREILAIEVESVADKTPICPFILGEPGIGKSSIIRAMCKEHDWHFFEVLCNQLGDRSDLTGCRSVKVTEKVNNVDTEIWKQVFFPHQAIQDAITCAKNNPDDTVVLFLDEINRTGSDITSAILSFTTARTIGTYTFPDNIRFIVAGNDKGNITALDSASISRFAQFKLKPSASTYMSIEENLNAYIEQVLKANPNFIFGKSVGIVTSEVKGDDDGDTTFQSEYEAFDDAAEGFQQITTPRTISGLNAFLNACDMKKLSYFVGQVSKDPDTGEDTTLLNTIIYGHVGNTQFANAIINAIMTDVHSGMNQNANTVKRPQKPAIYSSIMKCKDRQTRDTMIQGLDDTVKSQIIMYACYEKGKNNKDLIQAICQNYTANIFPSNIIADFINLRQADEIDPDNYAAFLNSNTPVATMMHTILGD